MKYSFLILMLIIAVASCSATSCNKEDDKITRSNSPDNEKNDIMIGTNVSIKVGLKTFTASLLDNNATKTFKEMLPLTISMTELNGNEKYYDLPKSLPANSSNPGSIKTGDLMLYGTNTLVLFYKDFATSYSYTKLGSVNDVSGLAAALGSGNVTVIFELK